MNGKGTDVEKVVGRVEAAAVRRTVSPSLENLNYATVIKASSVVLAGKLERPRSRGGLEKGSRRSQREANGGSPSRFHREGREFLRKNLHRVSARMRWLFFLTSLPLPPPSLSTPSLSPSLSLSLPLFLCFFLRPWITRRRTI